MARTDSDDDPMEEAVPLEESVNNSDVSAEIQSIHSFPTNHVDAMDIDSFSEAGTPTPSGRGPTLLEIVLPTLESLGREADEYAIFEDVYSDDDSEEVVRVLDEKEVDGNVMLFRVEFAGGDIEDDVSYALALKLKDRVTLYYWGESPVMVQKQHPLWVGESSL